MNIEKYAKIAPQYYTGEISKTLLNLFLNNKFKSILDCGCGDGSTIYALNKKRILRNIEVNAIDLSKDRISLVKRNFPKFKARIDSAESLDSVRDKSQDLIISTQVIEHVNDKKMMASLQRTLRKGGLVYLTTVFKKWYGWYFYKNKNRWVLDPTHLREYTKDDQLINIFNKNFNILSNKKSLQWFPLVDFLIKRIGITQINRDTNIWKLIRAIRIPIFGYYSWELVLKKKE